VEKYWEGRGRFMKNQAKRQNRNNKDKSLRKVADNYETKNKLYRPKKALDKSFFEYALRAEIEQNFAANTEALSLYWWDMDEAVTGGETILTNGYADAVDSYASPVRVKLGRGRSSPPLYYKSSPATVTHADETDGGNEKTVQVKHVVVTVPLGFLKAETTKF